MTIKQTPRVPPRLTLSRSLWAWLMRATRSHLVLTRIVVWSLNPRPVDPEAFPGLVARVADTADLERAQRDLPKHFPPEFVTQALARGDICIGIFDGERIISFSWATLNSAPHTDGLHFQVSPPFGYAYRYFTLPEYRGMGTGLLSLVTQSNVMLAMGATFGAGFIETHNYSSKAAATRAGAKTIGFAGYLRLFGRIRTFRSAGARRRRIGFVRSGQRTSSPAGSANPNPS